MSKDALSTAVQRLLPAVEAIAAIGAGIRVAKEGLQIDPRVEDAIREIMRAVDPALLEGAADDEKAMALSAIRAAFGFATDMLDDPARSSELADEVARAKVEILVVSLGKPRQELWIQSHAARTKARVFLAFGAAADFLAGVDHRAPVALQKRGLEWAYRLAREPRRLARRYLVEGPPMALRLANRPSTHLHDPHSSPRKYDAL